MSSDLISIIIPVKNERDRIRTIIDGLYKQTYRPIEVIFVDGDSTDGTIEEIMNVIKEYSSDDFFRVRLLRESDFGSIRSPANARNIGALNASGKYVAFFDADLDLREDPEVLNKAISMLKLGYKRVNIQIISNMHTWIEKNIVLDNIFHYGKGKSFKSNRHCCFDKELFIKILFDTNLGIFEDSDMINRLEKIYKDKAIIDTKIRFCWPHTVKSYLRQQFWYGKTIIRYLRKYNLSISKHIIRINATLGLLLLALFFLYYMPLFSVTLLILMFALIYTRWLRDDLHFLDKEAELMRSNRFFTLLSRLAWHLFREILAKSSYDAGLLIYLLKRGKVRPGR